MNVTVHVPQKLVPAVDGRRKVALGLPQGANPGDVLGALFTLYPRLRAWVPAEAGTPSRQLRLVAAPGADGGIRLSDGAHVYLVADQPHRLAEQAAGG